MRKPVPVAFSSPCLVTRRAMKTAIAAQAAATMGAMSAGMSTLPKMPDHFTEELPAWTSMAPTTPPMRAWLELEGVPRYHVTTFQRIAPIRPANTTFKVTKLASTIPLAMVAATDNDKKAPTKFNIADSPTAARGFSAFVAMEVAMALAVSWKPLVKSKPNAVTITSARIKLLLIDSISR